jgi:pantetheine-phosphate adenylyltransferase
MPTNNNYNRAYELFGYEWTATYPLSNTYHNHNHVRTFNFDKCPSVAAAIAALYHDSWYNPLADPTTNINAACKIFRQHANARGIDDNIINRVDRLIRTTQDHIYSIFNPTGDVLFDQETEWLISEDLKYFSPNYTELPNSIHRTELNVLKEYQFVDIEVYRTERILILESFLQLPSTIICAKRISDICQFLKSWTPNIGIFCGSFNPFHEGHLYVLTEASRIFDKVIVAQGNNLNKPISSYSILDVEKLKRYECVQYNSSIFDILDMKSQNCNLTLVRGIRDGGDLNSELALQTIVHNRCGVPSVNIFTCPEKSFISSGLVRELIHLKEATTYRVK